LAAETPAVTPRGNPAGGPVGSRHRQQLSGEFIAALLRDFRQGGPKAIERVRRTQPAAYMKICALLVPKELKVEHSGGVKAMTDEQLEQAIAMIQEALEQHTVGQVIDGVAEPVVKPAALPAPDIVPDDKPRRPNKIMDAADTAIGPKERKPRKCKVPSPPGS
jgi:hypothetical protein